MVQQELLEQAQQRAVLAELAATAVDVNVMEKAAAVAVEMVLAAVLAETVEMVVLVVLFI
jgi:putative hemolysin